MTLAQILQAIGQFIVTTSEGTVTGGAVYWVTQWVNTITNNPVLLMMAVAMPVAGFGIGALRRLINVN